MAILTEPELRGRELHQSLTKNKTWGYRDCLRRYRLPHTVNCNLLHPVQFFEDSVAVELGSSART